ncbi:MAG: hypothetical protein LBR91_03345 [Puniceicoccales bacterium]|jgi:hypothetical protein|nr:hypothetical protein [Puniceicoccales bacterium]
MDIREVKYGDLPLLAVKVSPSRYLFSPSDAGRMVSWQITMADDSIRDIFFSEISQENSIGNVGGKVFFNVKSMPISGFQDLNVEDLDFEKSDNGRNFVIFTVKNIENLPYLPRISYKLFELHFHLELALTNEGTLPIYWKPAIHFFVNLPWTEIPLGKHIAKGLAKKRLSIGDDMAVISSVKSSEKTSLELLNDGAIGFSKLRDNKIWVGTSNEEEGLSFIFGKKTQKSVCVLRKTETNDKIEVAFLSDLPTEDGSTVANLQNYIPVLPQKTETFSVEISAY